MNKNILIPLCAILLAIYTISCNSSLPSPTAKPECEWANDASIQFENFKLKHPPGYMDIEPYRNTYSGDGIYMLVDFFTDYSRNPIDGQYVKESIKVSLTANDCSDATKSKSKTYAESGSDAIGSVLYKAPRTQSVQTINSTKIEFKSEKHYDWSSGKNVEIIWSVTSSSNPYYYPINGNLTAKVTPTTENKSTRLRVYRGREFESVELMW